MLSFWRWLWTAIRYNNFSLRFATKIGFYGRGNFYNKYGNKILGLLLLGVSNIKGHKNFQVLALFGLCSICSQNLDECSLPRARKIFAIARIFVKMYLIAQNSVNPATFAKLRYYAHSNKQTYDIKRKRILASAKSTNCSLGLPVVLSTVLAGRKINLINACTRKKMQCSHVRKDHSIPLPLST